MNVDAPLPSNIEDITALVSSLYAPASLSNVSSTQMVLQRIQKSPQGWDVARQLLNQQDTEVKFFGALTIIVKLNTGSTSLGPEDALELLEALVQWLLACLEDESSSLVVRKLSSALTAFFLHFHRLWAPCVRHLVYCLAAQRFCRPQEFHQAEGSADIEGQLRALGRTKMQAVLWFLETMAEDSMRIDMDSSVHSGIYQSIADNVGDVSTLLSHALSTQEAYVGSARVKDTAIRCFQSWVLFVQRVSGHDGRLVAELRPLVKFVVEAMATEEELYPVAVEVIADILSNYSNFLIPDHYTLLHALLESAWFQERYHRLVVGGDFDFDSVQFGHLLLSFGEARLLSLMQDNDGQLNTILSSICGLLSAPGFPVADDKIFVAAIEFWSNFIEVMTDTVYSENTADHRWVQVSVDHVQRAIALASQKISFPQPEVFNAWDSADKAGFIDARKDVADLLQSSFTLIGPHLVSIFADAVLKCLVEASWVKLEAVAFCLGALAECLNGDTASDALLEPVFSPMLFDALIPSRQAMPPRTRQTCASLIEKYADYFERHPSILPHALNLLFNILGDTQMAATASKSINSLCWSCRAHLGTEVGAFLHQYESLVAARALDCHTNERIMGAVAAVLQPLESEEERLSGIRRLVGFVHDDVQRSCAMATDPRADQGVPPCSKADRCTLGGLGTNPALHVALRGLRCLVSIGKGLQAPVDGPVDLDSERRFQPSPHRGSAMWQLQEGIMAIVLQTRAMFPSSGEIVEAVCHIFRTGFSETEPGLFVLAPEHVCDYITGHELSSPRIGMVVSTACSFISSPSTETSTKSLQEIRMKMFSWVISILQQLPEYDSDTEVSQNGIEFATRLMGKHPETLLASLSADRVEFLFLFTLGVLDGSEPLPKAAAADFWVTFIMLRPNNPHLQDSHAQMMLAIGPRLARSIINNIGGKAARSELDKLSEPLKRLAANHARTRSWLEAALADSSFPSSQVSDHDKSMFLRRILSLRGARATNQVVRDFWLASRGTSFAYIS